MSSQLSFAPFLSPADKKRLGRQAIKVRDYMAAHAGEWLTLRMISAATGAPEASASARFRDLRAAGLPVEIKPAPEGNGLHLYRMRTGAEP